MLTENDLKKRELAEKAHSPRMVFPTSDTSSKLVFLMLSQLSIYQKALRRIATFDYPAYALSNKIAEAALDEMGAGNGEE